MNRRIIPIIQSSIDGKNRETSAEDLTRKEIQLTNGELRSILRSELGQ
jgi:hypothetical protein